MQHIQNLNQHCFDMLVEQTKEIMYQKWNGVFLADLIWTHIAWECPFNKTRFHNGNLNTRLSIKAAHNLYVEIGIEYIFYCDQIPYYFIIKRPLIVYNKESFKNIIL